MKSIPNVIQEVVGNQPYEEEQTGMSGARVLMFPDYVLKIRQESEETENERDMVSWLSGRLPVPEIPVYTVENGVAYTLMTRVRGSMLCAEEYLKQPRKLIRCAAKALQMLWGVDVKNCPDNVLPMVSAWKCPYHSGRMLLEMLRADMSVRKRETELEGAGA